MARIAASVTLLLSLLFLFTFTYSHARDITHPISEPETEPEKTKPQHDTVLDLDSIDPVPLRFVTFRPINRHIQPRHPLPLPLSLSFRLGHRRCRHGHRRVIPYGNDAIAAGDDRQIPARWVRIRHSQPKPRLSEMTMMFDHHDHDHDRDHEHHHHHDHEHGHGTEEGGFMKNIRKIRKFLNLF